MRRGGNSVRWNSIKVIFGVNRNSNGDTPDICRGIPCGKQVYAVSSPWPPASWSRMLASNIA